MAGVWNIKSGTRMRMAFDVAPGVEPNFNLVCTFYKSLDESAFLISVPMLNGKSLILDENQKLLINYEIGKEHMIISGYPDDVVTEGIHRYWKIRRVSEQRQFFQRADERYKVPLRVTYTCSNWEMDEKGKTEVMDGLTLDLSAGGAAVYLNFHFDVGEVIEFTLPRVGVTPEGRPQTVVSAICWYRDAPKGSIYRHICGLQFRFGGADEREKMKAYINSVRMKYKV